MSQLLWIAVAGALFWVGLTLDRYETLSLFLFSGHGSDGAFGLVFAIAMVVNGFGVSLMLLGVAVAYHAWVRQPIIRALPRLFIMAFALGSAIGAARLVRALY